MVKGKKKPEFLKYEEILKRTCGGYDIYMAYEGKVEKRMKRPWGEDKHPSFGIFANNGLWVWKDFAKETTGTAVEYVQNKFGLCFGDAIAKIKYDFGWSETQINKNPIKVTWEKKSEQTEVIPITFDSQPFAKKHHDFWNCVGVSEQDCKKLECWAIKTLVVNRKFFHLKKDEIAFAYYAPEEDKCKVYLPERNKDNRFINNVSYFYLWNLRNLKECDNGIIQKSYKDLIVTSMITPCVMGSQAEAVQIFNEDTVNSINSVFKNVWIWYGSDPDGVNKCKQITNTNKWKYINTPKNLLPEINDNYGFVKKFGLRKLEEFMKSKKFPL